MDVKYHIDHTCNIFPPVIMNFDLWPWPSNLNQYEGKPASQSEVKRHVFQAIV